MKKLVPLLALIPLVLSSHLAGKFVLPTAVLVVLFALLLAWFALGEEGDSVPGLGLFWLGPLSVVWSISERREGREVFGYTLPLGLAIAAVGTLLLLRKPVPKHHCWLVGAAILTWCVSFFGGSGGGADQMRPYYSLFGLSPELTWALIVWTRKLIHVTFYSLLATCFYRYLSHFWPKPHLHALSLALAMAACDEWRQNMIPNREGSIRDVLLDVGAASIWLWWRYLRKRSAKPGAPNSDARV